MSTTWRYRVGYYRGSGWFGIFEFYTDGNGKEGWTKAPVEPWGETKEDLRKDLERMLKAFDEPVIEIWDEVG